MTVIFSDNSQTGAEIWRSVIPPEEYYSSPVVELDDATRAELERDSTGLPRLLDAMDRRLAALRARPRTWGEDVDALADPVAWLACNVPSTRLGRAMLERLEERLGDVSPWIHDTSTPAHPGTARLPLAECRTRLDALEAEGAKFAAALGVAVKGARRVP